MKWLVTSVFLFPACALAQDAAPTAPKSFADLYPPLPGVEYFCTDSEGARVEIGQVICITASCITWMARCEMTSSNRMAIWRKMQDGCPGVLLDGAALSGGSVLGRIEALQPAV